MKRLLSNLGLIGLVILLAGSFIFADDLASWAFSKQLTYDNQEEVKAIYLDEEVYRHANQNLSDIRLVNEKGEFIPYYIYNGFKDTKQVGQETYTKSKTLDYQVESNKEEKETVISIDNKDRLRISTIMIKSQGDFKRDYRIYTSQEELEDLSQVSRGTIYQFNLEEAQIKDTRIQLEGLGDWFAPRFLQIVIDDRDDQPIVIDELEINYQIDKIVFKTTNSQDLHLLFGNKEAAKPEYDISSYKEEIEQSNQEEVVLLGLVKKDPGQSTRKRINFKWILNICVVIISVLLVVLILGKTSKAD